MDGSSAAYFRAKAGVKAGQEKPRLRAIANGSFGAPKLFSPAARKVP
jgi:hypothetical protein